MIIYSAALDFSLSHTLAVLCVEGRPISSLHSAKIGMNKLIRSLNILEMYFFFLRKKKMKKVKFRVALEIKPDQRKDDSMSE